MSQSLCSSHALHQRSIRCTSGQLSKVKHLLAFLVLPFPLYSVSPLDTRSKLFPLVESLKMHPIPIRRSFGALLALIVSALLLSDWKNGYTGRLAKRQLLVENSLIINSSSATNVSHLFNRHHIPLKHSHLHTSHTTQKRARTLNYHDAVCKGQKLIGQIQEVFEGKRAPGREYGPDDIQNGWSRQGLPRGIPDAFDEPFMAIGKTLPNIGERIPETSETYVVDLVQDQPFRNSAGKKQKVTRTDGSFPTKRENNC